MGTVVWLESGASGEVSLVGGKAANLIKLAAMGMPVPQGFCLTTRAYDSFVSHNGLLDVINSLLPQSSSPSLVQLEQASESIFVAFQEAPLPPGVEKEVLAAYALLSAKASNGPIGVAVRSSATAEDMAKASFAGQHDSFLNVRGLANLVKSVKSCWASLWSARAIHYRLGKGIDQSSVRMAVVVQRMVDAEVSAVTFTANPVSGQDNQMIANISWGLGESIVSGLVTPDSYVLTKEPLSIVEASVEDKATMVVFDETNGTKEVEVPPDRRRSYCAEDDSVLANARLCLEIERRLGFPVDVESAFSNGQWYVLQARPITA